MQSRRHFIKIFFSFFVTILTLKYSKLLQAMKIIPYHHLSDGTFRNLPGGHVRNNSLKSSKFNFFRFFYKGIIKREMFDQKEIPENIPSNHFLPQDEALKIFLKNKDDISITWLGHASFLIKIESHYLLIDPFLSKTAGPFGIGPNRYIPSGIKISDLPKINTIIISHNHYDHLDTKTLIKIKNKKEIQIICPLKLSKTFHNLGYKNIVELDWYDAHYKFNCNIVAIPAYHWSRRLSQKRNSTLWNGYIIEYKSKKIYFAGDTAYGNIFSEIGKKFGPFDLTILPIGAYEPRSMMQTSHCTPEEAVEISLMLQSKNILGMHWGTIRLSAENPWEPPKRFKQAALLKGYKNSQIWNLSIGQTKSLT